MLTKEDLLVKLKSLRRLHEDDTEGKAFRDKVLSAIEAFPFNEKSIITAFYINGLRWVQVSSRMRYSDRHCKNFRQKAVDDLLIVLNRNDKT